MERSRSKSPKRSRSKSPKRLRSKSPKRLRSKSPKRVVEESADPLSHFMTPYLDLQSLSNLSMANKTFKKISGRELKSRKEDPNRINRLALNYLRTALFPLSTQEYNVLTDSAKLNAKINFLYFINSYESILEREVVQRMKELVNQISGETVFQL